MNYLKILKDMGLTLSDCIKLLGYLNRDKVLKSNINKIVKTKNTLETDKKYYKVSENLYIDIEEFKNILSFLMQKEEFRDILKSFMIKF
jgi:antitoxin component of RelBE/YafQ-DinJ toxin-antitoxin module